eukprot:2196833-Pyramimonas_sp.AAC.1
MRALRPPATTSGTRGPLTCCLSNVLPRCTKRTQAAVRAQLFRGCCCGRHQTHRSLGGAPTRPRRKPL